jgi:hypothetical protein
MIFGLPKARALRLGREQAFLSATTIALVRFATFRIPRNSGHFGTPMVRRSEICYVPWYAER